MSRSECTLPLENSVRPQCSDGVIQHHRVTEGTVLSDGRQPEHVAVYTDQGTTNFAESGLQHVLRYREDADRLPLSKVGHLFLVPGHERSVDAGKYLSHNVRNDARPKPNEACVFLETSVQHNRAESMAWVAGCFLCVAIYILEGLAPHVIHSRCERLRSYPVVRLYHLVEGYVAVADLDHHDFLYGRILENGDVVWYLKTSSKREVLAIDDPVIVLVSLLHILEVFEMTFPVLLDG